MSNQSARHAAVNAILGISGGTYEGSFGAMFDADSIPAGTFNGRLLAWLNEYLGVTHTTLSGAQHAFALANGAADWNGLATWDALAGAGLWAGYFAAAGVTNGTAQGHITTFYNGLATDGIQSKIKVFVLLGAESATAKNMMSDAYHGSLVNSPTFTQWLGQRCNGTDNYISTGTALSSITGLTANSTMIGIGTSQDDPGAGSYSGVSYLVAEDSAPSYTASIIAATFNNSDQFLASYPVNDAWGGGDSTPVAWGTLTNVRVYASRTGASANALYYGPTGVGTETQSAVALPDYPLFIAAYNSDGTPAFGAQDATFDAKWYCIAEGLSGAEVALLDARIVTLITALEAL